MMRLYPKINLINGLFVEDAILDAIPMLPIGTPDPAYIDTPCPPGFYWPRWDGEKWVEGGTVPETVAPEPTETECLQAQLAQTNADFMGFLDYFFSMFPEAE